MKFVHVTGSVISGLGKGIAASSIGVLLQNMGFTVTAIKIDPYLNVDASLMNPGQHGEVYTLSDGSEVDLDFGSYERFLDISLTRDNSITSGKIYQKVIAAERAGEYLGQTVQVIPHFTDTVQEWISRAAHLPVTDEGKTPDVCIIELGGTVGDIESMPFVEALRQLQSHADVDAVCNVHVTLLPIVNGEVKTKPAQNSVAMMRSAGLCPDIMICRHDSPCDLPEETYSKLSKMCGLPASSVVSLPTEKILWKVPLILHERDVGRSLRRFLRLDERLETGNLDVWKNRLVERRIRSKPSLKVAVVGKYVKNTDAYLSVVRALQHAALEQHTWVDIEMIDSESIDSTTVNDRLKNVDGILIPGGFGKRGIDGLIDSCEFARVNKRPFLGICLGFQLAVIEFARNVMGVVDAESREFDDSGTPLVIHLPDYSDTISGATLRLGSHETRLVEGESIARSLYDDVQKITERHRHRYEINPSHVKRLEEHGLRFTGTDISGVRMEICELSQTTHPFYLGCQFHPEFQSRPMKPTPVFTGFIRAISRRSTVDTN